jgi:hypothetical protein
MDKNDSKEIADPTQAEGTTVEPEKTTVTDDPQAGEPGTDGAATEPAASEDDPKKDADDADKEDEKIDPDLIPDDEPIRNMGELRAVRKRNASLSRRLKEAEEAKSTLAKEFEEFKSSNTGGSSEADTQKIADLEARLKEFTDKEEETAKVAALKEAGLSEELLEVLDGDEAKWKKTIEILAKTQPTTNPSKRLKGDSITNGVGDKYKSDRLTDEERRTMARNLL